jgi:cell wall assembly regulator SMI1
MDEIWDRIEAWLAQHAPAVLAGLNGPATEQELDATERALGVKLPEDVRASYRRHNGQPDSKNSLLGGWDFMRLDRIRAIWKMLTELFAQDQFKGFRNDASASIMSRDWWNPKWVPFAENGSGDHYCIDLAPGKRGKLGQVVLWYHDDGTRPILARDLRAFFSDFAKQLKRGEYVYDPEYGGRLKRRDEH